MGLASSLALIGLGTLALPVLLHLMRHRELPTRSLPTLRLLERAAAESRQRFRIRDRLLLALRLAALAALAFAAAGPFLLRERAFDDDRLSSLAIVLDDSLSMQREDGGETLFETAVDRVSATVDGMAEGSEVSIVLAGSPPRLLVPRTDAKDAALRALRGLDEESARGTDLASAVDLARRSLAGAKHVRRMWVLSDLATHTGIADARLPTEGVEVVLDRVGAEGRPNYAVVDAWGAPDPTRPGESSIQVAVRGPDGETTLRIESEGQALREELLILTDGSARATLHVPADRPGATVVIAGDDDLPADNRRAVLLGPPAALEVLLVDGDPHPARTEDEVGFLSRALDVLPGGAFRYTTVDADALRRSAIEAADVVVLANTPPLSVPAANALTRHVEAGGGLWITGGSLAAPRSLRARLRELLPAEVGAAMDVGSAAVEPALGSASVRRLLALEPKVDADVVRTAAGHPIDIRGSHEEGRVAIWASTLDDDWTNVPYHPGYVAFVAEVLRELGAKATPPPQDLAAGDTIPVAEGLRVQLPDGDLVLSEGEFTETNRAGVYRILDDDDDLRFAFRVAPPANESELRPAELPETNDGAPASSAGVSRRPIAPWWFLLGGLLLLAEGLLRRLGPLRAAQEGTG
ncbi:MAG: BatA and WFA domain-containing protein [Myxococcota bacterium]